MTRIEQLNELVELFLRAGNDDARHQLYQLALREARPTAEEIGYIDREVALRRAQSILGKTAMPASPSYLPAADVIAAFRGTTPMSRLYRCINSMGGKWESDTQDSMKAYVMACFSELAYLHLTEHELAGRDRYKIFDPSLALAEFKRRRLEFNLVEVVRAAADIPLEIIETPRFVYVIGFLNTFVVIAVRGTVPTSLSDWWMDFEAFKNHAQNGFYHRGFGDEADLALPLLFKAVGTRHPLYITGHSMGAAVASILTQIWPDRPIVRTPYLFASPRFGTRAAARRLPRYSYLRPLDIVPHTPPRFLGYSDEGAIVTVLPPGSKQGGGWGNLWHAVSRLTAEHHSMEGIRGLMGNLVGEAFPERIYIDAIIAKLKETRTRNGSA